MSTCRQIEVYSSTNDALAYFSKDQHKEKSACKKFCKIRIPRRCSNRRYWSGITLTTAFDILKGLGEIGGATFSRITRFAFGVLTLLCLLEIATTPATAGTLENRGIAGELISLCEYSDENDDPVVREDRQPFTLGSSQASESCPAGRSSISTSVTGVSSIVTVTEHSFSQQTRNESWDGVAAYSQSASTEWDVVTESGDCSSYPVLMDWTGTGSIRAEVFGPGSYYRLFTSSAAEGQSVFAFTAYNGSTIRWFPLLQTGLFDPGTSSRDLSLAISLSQTVHASIAPDLTSGDTPLAVNFTNFSCGPIEQYAWDFGDGQTSNSSSPGTIIYTTDTCDDFTACLSVTGPENSDTSNCYNIHVENPEFAADFTYSQDDVTDPTVTFTDLSGGPHFDERWWNFGDGTGWILANNPNHTFPADSCKTETYDVTYYIARSDASCEREITKQVEVQNVCSFEISEAMMISPTELGVNLLVTVPDSDPIGGPWSVYFAGEINGTSVTTEQFDLSDLLDPGDTDKEIHFDSGTNPRIINLVDYGVERFSSDVHFTLSAFISLPNGEESQASRDVTIRLPVIIVHGWTGEQLLASIPLRIYESLIDHFKLEGYTTDPTWYQTIWFKHYLTQKWSSNQVVDWLDRIVIDAIDATYANKVNIVGHSLGGLIGRYYISEHADHAVNAMVMIGTPNSGSTAFYISSDRWSLDRVLRKIDKAPLIQWVIPTYPSLFDINNNIVSPPIANNYPDPALSPNVRYLSIYNTAIGTTPEQIQVEDRKGWFDALDNNYAQGSGDGTVTSNSAHLDGATNLGIETETTHAFLTKDNLVQDSVLEFLQNVE